MLFWFNQIREIPSNDQFIRYFGSIRSGKKYHQMINSCSLCSICQFLMKTFRNDDYNLCGNMHVRSIIYLAHKQKCGSYTKLILPVAMTMMSRKISQLSKLPYNSLNLHLSFCFIFFWPLYFP